jgi:hypothetical protein
MQLSPAQDQSELPLIVTVIEAGALERQVRLLVESLRKWGGRLAKARVFAIQPRRGPSLRIETTRALDALQIEYQRIMRDDHLHWFPYLNKTAAVKYVAQNNPTSRIIWLDADTLIVNEPSSLILPQGIQFSACASDKNIGTAHDEDRFSPYFKACCSTLGVNFASLPYIETEAERIAIRAYWNSGVYAFDANSGLAETHHEFTLKLVTKGIASFQSKLFFSDQISLGLAAHSLNLKYSKLPLTHNFSIQPSSAIRRLTESANDVRIVHYHGCMWPEAFGDFCLGLRAINEEAAAWLRSAGPLRIEMRPAARIHRKFLEIHRNRKLSRAVSKSHIY